MAKAAEGKGRCAMCGELITWRKNEAGTLSYFCQDCDFQGYAKAGTLANRLASEEAAKFKASAQNSKPSQPAETMRATKPASKPATPAQDIPPKPAPTQPKAGSGLLMG